MSNLVRSPFDRSGWYAEAIDRGGISQDTRCFDRGEFGRTFVRSDPSEIYHHTSRFTTDGTSFPRSRSTTFADIETGSSPSMNRGTLAIARGSTVHLQRFYLAAGAIYRAWIRSNCSVRAVWIPILRQVRVSTA